MKDQEDLMADSRFQVADKDAEEMLELVREKWFKHLRPAKIKILFDLKKRMRGQKLVLGRMMKANDLIKRLTDHFYPGGCDYVLFLDKVAFTMVMQDADKKRMVRHELRHIAYDPGSGHPWKIAFHDIEDFEEEIKMNQDNPGWAKRVVGVTAGIYEQQKEAAKEKRPSSKPKRGVEVLMKQRRPAAAIQ